MMAPRRHRVFQPAPCALALGLCVIVLTIAGCGERGGDAAAKAPAQPPAVPVTV
jgi:hypothetical protein